MGKHRKKQSSKKLRVLERNREKFGGAEEGGVNDEPSKAADIGSSYHLDYVKNGVYAVYKDDSLLLLGDFETCMDEYERLYPPEEYLNQTDQISAHF